MDKGIAIEIVKQAPRLAIDHEINATGTITIIGIRQPILQEVAAIGIFVGNLLLEPPEAWNTELSEGNASCGYDVGRSVSWL